MSDKLRKATARLDRRRAAYTDALATRAKRMSEPGKGYHRPGSMSRRKPAPAGARRH